MNDAVRIRRTEDGLVVIAAAGAPTVLDPAARLDVTVLEVLGGHLTWHLLDGTTLPAAVLERVELAQEWLWAVFGEQVALAVEAAEDVELPVTPELPDLTPAAWRLAYAHWASRWWPASTIDGIAPLDERLLLDEIAALSAECEMLLDGADLAADEADLPVFVGRAEDYALAAGPAMTPPGGALVLARGTTGWNWRRCPPGLLDAAERAISWTVLRADGRTTVTVRAVAAPGLRGPVPLHLRPHALVHTSAGPVHTALTLHGDAWTGEVAAPADADPAVRIEVSVPGVGDPGLADNEPASSDPNGNEPRSGAALGSESGDADRGSGEPSGAGLRREGPGTGGRRDGGSHAGVGGTDLDGPEIRRRIRDFASDRLRRAADPGAGALAAETAAAATDSDF